MKISLNWLKELVDIPCASAELAERLTMAGLEVESIENEASRFDNIVVGHVNTRIKHPNADTLNVCGVDVGDGVMREIVCGAPNVAAGQKVAVALVGAKIGDIVIAKRKLRGVVSNGMICSERELGLGETHAGIMVLEDRAVVGQPFAEYLGADTIFEIGITPNRADALSHLGVARDVAALFGSQIRRPVPQIVEGPVAASALATVEIRDPARCPRYVARVVRGVRVGPSPAWLAQRLARIGVRSINNVVDATNFVLMECGHPLHAFDYDMLAGHAIVVQCAASGEEFVTLDGKTRTLRDDTLLICDSERGVAIAGVMGGANAEISESTTNVLIESAYFDPASIRKTSKYLGLSTDASYRFERGTDIENAVYAADRVTALIAELAGGEVASGRIDAYPAPRTNPTIRVRMPRVNAVLGAPVDVEEAFAICERLGFAPVADAYDAFNVTVPTWRPDVSEEIDIVEDIARIAGYNRFMPSSANLAMRVPVAAAAPDDVRDTMREFLVAAGYVEIVTSSLVEEKTAAAYSTKFVRLANPISSDMAIVRPHPLPQALAALALNARRGSRNARLFEISNAYEIVNPDAAPVNERYAGIECLTMVWTGTTGGGWDAKPRPVDFFDVKGDVERLLARLGIDNHAFIAYNADGNGGLTEQSLAIAHGGRTVGRFGSVRPELTGLADLDAPVFAVMIEIAPLRRAGRTSAKYVPPPRFPWVVRDLALVAPKDRSSDELRERIRASASSPLLRAVTLFDVFEGPPAVAEGMRSVGYSLTFGADDRTLRDEEIDAVISRIVRDLHDNHGVGIRA